MGDFNIALMKRTVSLITPNLQYHMLIFFSPFIFQPTRVSEKAKTLIDNKFIDNFDFTATSYS